MTFEFKPNMAALLGRDKSEGSESNGVKTGNDE